MAAPPRIGGGDFSSGVTHKIQPGWSTLIVSVSVTRRVMTLVPRASNDTLTFSVTQGDAPVAIDGDYFESVTCAAADSGVQWVDYLTVNRGVPLGGAAKLPRNTDGSLVVGGITNGIKQILGGSGNPVMMELDPADLVLVEQESFGPANIAAGAAEASAVVGSTTIPVNSLVRFRASVIPQNLATGASTLVYIAVKGQTSGDYYAVCAAGSVSGSFRIGMAEKLNIVTRNQDSVARGMSFTWESFTGDV